MGFGPKYVVPEPMWLSPQTPCVAHTLHWLRARCAKSCQRSKVVGAQSQGHSLPWARKAGGSLGLELSVGNPGGEQNVEG